MRGFAAADGLALIEFDNAQALRAAGWQKPILMLEGCFDAHDMQTALQERLTVTVHPDVVDTVSVHVGQPFVLLAVFGRQYLSQESSLVFNRL